ncbi:MAG: endonuclease [Bacteroidetes bacterium]|nr:endonuclease [Bacteroidota bacterium]
MKPTFFLVAVLALLFQDTGAQVIISAKTISFGSKPANQKDSLSVTLTNPTAAAVSIGALSSSDSAFTLRAEASSIPSGSSKKVWIRLNAKHNITYNERVFITLPSTLQIFILTVTASVTYTDNNGYYATTQNLWDNQLRDTLQAITGRGYNTHSTSASSSYDQMREYMYATADDYDYQDTIECVYTGVKGHVTGRSDAFVDPYKFNAEHTWPQSMFDDANGNPVLPMYSDLHHLFPANATANQERSNYPFGVVSGTPTWAVGGSKKGTLTTGGTGFEPRDVHKGNVTRSMFYFITRYQNYSNFMTTAFETALRNWAKSDPVDANEKTRNTRVQAWQGNRNPFIDHPEFIDRIYDFVNRLSRPNEVKLAVSSTNIAMGARPSGSTSSFYFKFTNTGPKVTNLESATLTGTGFSIGYKPAVSKTIGQGIADSIEIKYTSTSSSAVPAGSLTISLATATASKVFTIQINGSGNGDYNNTGGTTGGSTQPTGSTSPVTGITASGVDASSGTLNWTLPGDYNSSLNEVIVLLKQGSSPSSASGNTSAVVANSNFSVATAQLGSDGKLIYRGDGNSVAITGLTSSSVYYADIYVVHSDITYSSVSEGSFTTSAPVSSDLINEGFAGGSTAPSGWTFTSIGTYTTTGNFGAASPSLRFDGSGDQIVTPVFSSPSQLSFWYKGQGTSASSPSTFRIEELNGSTGQWSDVVVMTTFATTGTTVTLPLLITSVQLRFTYTKNVGNLSFDDVKITGYNLPVELSSFSGIQNGNRYTITWATASETNNFGWEIERKKVEHEVPEGSSSGISNQNQSGPSGSWETLGFVSGKGTTTEAQYYEFSSPVIRHPSPAVFRLKQIDLDGTISFSKEIEIREISVGMLLMKAYPNPFNPETKLEITLPESADLQIDLFNSLGQKVKTIEKKVKPAGNYTYIVSGNGLTSGVYFVRMTAGAESKTIKLVLLK